MSNDYKIGGKFLGHDILPFKMFVKVSNTDLASNVNGLKPPTSSHTNTPHDHTSAGYEYPSAVCYLNFIV